ncbi:YpzI family protein [Bacillus sinesaloumensis]|nr:YpzI family protein [Bacillus sinesaloumensis]
MGKDRQEGKQRKERLTESDRDQSIDYPGATRLDTPDEARDINRMNPK